MAITLFPDGRIQKNGVEIGTQEGGGLMNQRWCLTANFTNSSINSEDIVAAGFTKNSVSNAIYGTIENETMTTSTGVFTFPSTGIYEIICKVMASRVTGDNKYVYWYTNISTDSGSSYTMREQGTTCMTNFSGTNTINIYSSLLIKVTNATTTRVRFGMLVGKNTVTIMSTASGTSVTFKKISEL